MNYYLDTEFLEGSQDKRFLGFKVGKTRPTIDLISLGLVSEEGKEYYAISKDFNLKEVWSRYDLAEPTPQQKLCPTSEYEGLTSDFDYMNRE